MLSFDQLYHLHAKRVFNTSLHYVHVVEDAEEVTQNVFLKIDEHLSQFKEESALSTWIYRITVNESLDFLKRKKRKKRWAIFTSIDENKDLSISSVHPGIVYEYKEELELLLRWIDELPEAQRSAVILCKIENFTLQEAADIMQVSYKSLEAHLGRAKKSLLEKKEAFEGKNK